MISLVLKQEQNDIIIYLSDITQSESKITIEINGKCVCDEYSSKFIKNKGNNYTKLIFSTKDNFGSTSKYVLKKSK